MCVLCFEDDAVKWTRVNAFNSHVPDCDGGIRFRGIIAGRRGFACGAPTTLTLILCGMCVCVYEVSCVACRAGAQHPDKLHSIAGVVSECPRVLPHNSNHTHVRTLTQSETMRSIYDNRGARSAPEKRPSAAVRAHLA